MKCPNCQNDLLISHRHTVEIDYCPSCRGVWLDRGELDKLIQRAERYDEDGDPDHDDDDHDGNDGRRRRYPQQGHRGEEHAPRRRSFWQELFD